MKKLLLKKCFLLCCLFTLLFSFTLINFVFAENSKNTLDTNATSAILIDSATGKVLYEKNSTKKMYPASLTKILTAIIVLENCNLEDTVTISYDSVMNVASRLCNS